MIYSVTNVLTSTCPRTEVNDNVPSLGEIFDHHVESPAIGIYLDRNYRYIRVAIHIPHYAGLTPIPYIGEKMLPTGDRTSATSHILSSKQYALMKV